MADSPSFAKMVPGFEFLQGLVKNAGAALPGIGQWVAPTLNPEELEKRIEELRTVQFWLEQNARMLGTTIQALEVQRMTLSTLKTMNVQMDDLRESIKAKMPGMPPADSSAAAEEAEAPSRPARKGKRAEPAPDPMAAAAAAAVDPMQWWGALTKQFTQIAGNAMKDSATDAAKALAGSMVKQSIDAASQTLKSAVAAPAKVAAQMAGSAAKAAGSRKAAAPGAKKTSSAPRKRTAAKK